VGGDEAEVLRQRSFPLQIAIFRKAEKRSADSVDVDVFGSRIHDRGRPADPVRWHVSQKQVHPTLPENFSRIDVETQDALLAFGAFAGGVLQVEVISRNHRRGSCPVRDPPLKVLAVRGPARGQAFF